MSYCPINQNSNICSTTANINQTDTQFLFIICQYRITGSQLFQDNIIHFQITPVYTFDDILNRTFSTCNHMHIDFQTHSRHTNWFTNAFLIINQELLRQNMQYFLIGRNCHCSGSIHHTFQIICGNFLIPNSHHTM